METIDFKNPGDVTKLNLVTVYRQLLPLRDKPEEFEVAANSLKESLMKQLGSGDYRDILERTQKIVDSIVKNAPDAEQGAVHVLLLATCSLKNGVALQADLADTQRAITEAASAIEQ